MNKMPIILHIHVPLHVYCIQNRDPTLLFISVRKQQHETVIYHTISIYEQAANMVLKWKNICHIPKLLNVHQWEKYAKYMPHIHTYINTYIQLIHVCIHRYISTCMQHIGMQAIIHT